MNLTERNKELMKKFETMINTADEKLAEELVDSNAPFYTPASPEPLYGGKGYLSVVFFCDLFQFVIKQKVLTDEPCQCAMTAHEALPIIE